MNDGTKMVHRSTNMDVKAYESEAERLVKTKKLTKKAKEELKLYNATMKINRLRLLEANIGLHLVNGYSDLERMTKQKMTDETVAEYKRQAGILGETVKDVETRAKNLVNQSFQNATWSERIWTNQTALKNTLSTELMRGMIAGKSAFTIASNIRKRFDVSSTEAKRLARTELVRCQAGAQIDSYQNHGWKEYEFRAYGSKSCEICRSLNGKHYPLADAMPAENLPPMHPNCRCSTIPYEDEDEYQQWLDSFDRTEENIELLANFIGSSIFSQKKYLNSKAGTSYNEVAEDEIDEILEKAYNKSVKLGNVTPLAGAKLYQRISKEIDKKLVGIVTANGIEIKGKSYHFIDRVIGSVYQKRSGVPIDIVLEALTSPDKMAGVKESKNGRSQKFVLKGKCSVSVNPDTGNLIQVNPLG